jgi:hypothetical protein
MGSTNHPMNNNTGRRRKEKKDFSVDNNKVPKQQKTTTKADVMDMSAGIIDIDDTPDVATWNKKIHIKDDAAGITVNPLHEAEIPPPTTNGIGLRDKKGSKKDLIIDPANKKEVDEAIKSGSTLTDEVTDLS